MNENLLFSIDDLIKYLNDIKETDSKALFDLLTHRVHCNKELLKHPTCLCGTVNKKMEWTDKLNDDPACSLLGVLNGFFCHIQGIDENSTDHQFAASERLLIKYDNKDIYNNCFKYNIYNTRDYK
jgi:hypothetical protein